MKILMGMPHPEVPGGPGKHLPQLVNYLETDSKVELETFIFNEGTLKAKTLTNRILTTLKLVLRILKRRFIFCPHLIHINSAYDKNALLRDVFVVTFMKLTKPWGRIFIKFHGSDASLLARGGLFSFLTGLLLWQLNGIGVLSTEEKNNFARYFPSSTKRLYVVQNIVDTSGFNHARKGLREKYKLKEDTSLIMFIARFVATKGLVEVIKAFGLIQDKFPKAHLLLAGDGDQMPLAQKMVKELNLEKRVVFTGYVGEELETSIYLESDMLVFPTLTEGFAMSIFFSVASGLPIITTKIRAAADYLKEPDNCLWVDYGNEKQLAEKIELLLGDPDLRASMKKNNLALGSKFNGESVGKSFVGIYEKICFS